MKDAAAKKRERYEDFLSKVKILNTMEAYERSKLADALKSLHYEAGDVILQEGDSGDDFFFIEKGEAIATKTIEAGKAPIEVMQYVSGDYFGE